MIVISGASKGIGKFLFHHFAIQGDEPVVGTYFHTAPKEFENFYFKLDVKDFHRIEEFVEKIKPGMKDITLINCAGINYNSFAHKSDITKWQEVVETNLFGTFNLIRAFLPVMREQKFGRIINFSSVAAQKPTPGVSSYASSKAALWGLARSLAVENAALNITINNINMGYSMLGMIKEVPENYLNGIIAQIPSGRLCDGQEILNTVHYLKNTSYVTGTSIDLSGGLV